MTLVSLLSIFVRCHDELVKRMPVPFFYLSCSLSNIIDLVRCGLIPLVPTSSIHVYCHDMRIEVLWNQNAFSLVCLSWCSFIALLDSIPLIGVKNYGKGIKGRWIPCPFPLYFVSFVRKPLICLYLS